MKKENNAHLVYLTGLSMDKKRLNYITENINRDIDFTYWFKNTQEAVIDIIENKSKNIIEGLDTNINIIKVISNIILENKFSNNYKTLKENVHPILTDLLDAKSDEGSYKFSETWKNNIDNFFSQMSDNVKKYHNGDFFSLYLSHQSDSIGVAPLSKIANSDNMTLLNSYCDKPYYDNQYINHVILKIDKKAIKDEYCENFEDFVNSNFYIHFLDTFLSKLIGDTKIPFGKINNDTDLLSAMKEIIDKAIKDNKTMPSPSYYDMVTNGGELAKNLADIQSSLSERNFYGLSLLNQFFYNLDDMLVDEKLNINVENNFHDKKEFLKELIVSSTNPNSMSFSTDANIEAKIYFSDGLKLLDKENSEDLSYASFKTFNRDKREDIKMDTASDDEVDANYIIETEKAFFIKIPIKMALSLPINEEGKVDSSLFIPYGIDSNKHKVIDIITVGGAEHNRALAHLINKHRLEYKEKRLFGFMDNKYDLKNKIKYIRDEEYEHSFLMGLNQPVSGYNAIFSARVDDDMGESVSWNTKLLGYRLKESESKTYNVLSIYGFSALASVFGMHHIVSEIHTKDENSAIDKEYGLFEKAYLPVLKPLNPKETQIFMSKGLSALILYPKSSNTKMEKQFNSKVPLYVFNNDIELYKKTFLLSEDEESIYATYKQGRNTQDLT